MFIQFQMKMISYYDIKNLQRLLGMTIRHRRQVNLSFSLQTRALCRKIGGDIYWQNIITHVIEIREIHILEGCRNAK